MRYPASVIVIAALLATAPSARAAPEDDRSDEPPGALAGDGLEEMLDALDDFLRSIPRFEPPVMTEEGDIIIRRKRHTAPVPEPAPRSDDAVQT